MDEEAENRLGFTLKDATARANENKNTLLQGYRIYCVETVHGGFDAYKSIVEANGGDCMLFRGRVSMPSYPRREESDDEDSDEDGPARNEVYLISNVAPEHVKVWPRFRHLVQTIGKTPRVVRPDWLLDIAMSQKLHDAERFQLTEDMAAGQSGD